MADQQSVYTKLEELEPGDIIRFVVESSVVGVLQGIITDFISWNDGIYFVRTERYSHLTNIAIDVQCVHK